MPPPYVVKPNAQGSSVGVFIVREGANRPPEQLLDPDWTFGEEVLVEEFIDGKELTVAVMHEGGPRALAVTEILPAGEWYDFDAKYAEGGSRHEVPANIPPTIADQLMRCGRSRAPRARLPRRDARGLHATIRKRDRVALLEVNTQPGMTPTSLVPEQAAHVGMSYDELVAVDPGGRVMAAMRARRRRARTPSRRAARPPRSAAAASAACRAWRASNSTAASGRDDVHSHRQEPDARRSPASCCSPAPPSPAPPGIGSSLFDAREAFARAADAAAAQRRLRHRRRSKIAGRRRRARAGSARADRARRAPLDPLARSR